MMKSIQKLSAALTKWTPWFISAVALATFFCPEVFGWVRGNVQTFILGVIMLTMGMTLTADDFRVLVSHPFDIAIGSLAQFTLMPLIALGVSRLLALPDAVAVGLILVGCCPGGVSSNLMSFLCKGDVAFSVGITSLSTLFAPLTTPLLMWLLAGQTVEVDALGMFRSVLLVTLMPVGAGFLFNRFLGSRPAYRETMKIMPGVAVVALACIVGGVVSAQHDSILKSGFLIFVGVFLHNVLGYALGYASGVFARFTNPKKRTISLEVGMQNAGLATVLATKHFPALPEVALASAVSCVWHSISGALLAGVFNMLDRLTSRGRA